MKGKLYLGKIDVSKIDKSKLFKGKKGTYCDVTIWINDEPDQFGNHMSIEQSTKKEENKVYLGNCKEWNPQPHDLTPAHDQAETTANDPEWMKDEDGDVDDLPF